MREYTVVIEQDEDGIYVASVPELPGCHTQAKTLGELNERIKEAIQLYLEVKSENETRMIASKQVESEQENCRKIFKKI